MRVIISLVVLVLLTGMFIGTDHYMQETLGGWDKEADACIESLMKGDMEAAHTQAQSLYTGYLEKHETLCMLHTHRDIVQIGSDMVLLITDIEMNNQMKAIQSARLLAHRTRAVRDDTSVALVNIF